MPILSLVSNTYAFNRKFLNVYVLPILITLILTLTFSTSALTQEQNPCELAKKILPRVEALTKITNKLKFSCMALNHKDYDNYTNSLVKKSISIKDIKIQELLLKKLGILQESYKYTECMMFGTGEQTDALYDMTSRKIILRSDSAVKPSIIAHELVHMLQDSEYNLKEIGKNKKEIDSIIGLEGLTEGHAMYYEKEYAKLYKDEELIPAQNLSPTSVENESCNYPEPLASILYFSYEWGKIFNANIIKKNINAFKKIPKSSREILYPDDYTKGLVPSKVKLKILFKDNTSMKLIYKDSLGEYILRALLKSVSTMSEGILAAKGLVSDEITLSKMIKTNQHKISWRFHFENDNDILQLTSVINKLALQVAGIKINPVSKNWIATNEKSETWGFKTHSGDAELVVSF